MTANQIAYWNYRENSRANREREKETHRSNLAQETETNRSNVARETETHRSNVVNERLKHETNVINATHFERMDTETERSNRAREEETSRHNRATETTDFMQAQAALGRSSAAQGQVQLGYGQLNEQTRSHLVQEQLSFESLAEQARHNVEQEAAANTNALANFFGKEASVANAETNRAQLDFDVEKWPTYKENVESQSELNKKKSQTETYNQIEKASQAFSNVGRVTNDAFRNGIELFKIFLPGGK